MSAVGAAGRAGCFRHPGLAERVASPEALGAFRTTEAGRYLLAVVQAYEDALNDAWLPFGIVRLPLDQARRFLGMLADELERHPLDEAWHRVASCHRSLMAR